MREDLEVFENRNDDWLAKEKKYEESVSAWDFDEGRKLKEIHEKNCDSLALKEEHETKHDYYNKTHEKGVINNNSQYVSLDGKQFIKLFIPVLAVFMFIFILFIFISIGEIDAGEMGFAFPIIMFVVISLIASPKNKRRK